MIDANDEAMSDAHHENTAGSLPDSVIQLQKELLGDYMLPSCPTQAPLQHPLSKAEELSLQHYFAWTDSHGTVKAYNAHAKVLAEATTEKILSLYKVRQLAMNLTKIKTSFIHICPKSCMAFTGKHQSDTICSHNNCGELWYKSHEGSDANLKPRATMLYMPIIPIIQAYYASDETSTATRHRDNVLKQTLEVAATAAGVKRSEFANSGNHTSHYSKLGLFKDKRDTALAISTDGAQLTMKKQSNMWLLIVVLLNLPPEMCYKSRNVILPLAISRTISTWKC